MSAGLSAIATLGLYLAQRTDRARLQALRFADEFWVCMGGAKLLAAKSLSIRPLKRLSWFNLPQLSTTVHLRTITPGHC